jgi:hypothetical protein
VIASVVATPFVGNVWCFLRARRSDREFVVCDGREGKPDLVIGRGSWSFCSNGHHLAYLAAADGVEGTSSSTGMKGRSTR